jgi:hypothetical protein
LRELTHEHFATRSASSGADFERQVVSRLTQRQLCSRVLYKEQVLRQDQLEGVRELTRRTHLLPDITRVAAKQ